MDILNTVSHFKIAIIMTFGVADHELNSCALISQRAFLHFIHSDVVALQYSERFI